MAFKSELPAGAYGIRRKAAPRARRSSAATTPSLGSAHAETQVDHGLAPNKSSFSRLQTFGDLIELHIADKCEVGKPPRRSKATTGTTLERNLGNEKIGRLDRQKLIDTGKMQAEQGAGWRGPRHRYRRDEDDRGPCGGRSRARHTSGTRRSGARRAQASRSGRQGRRAGSSLLHGRVEPPRPLL